MFLVCLAVFLIFVEVKMPKEASKQAYKRIWKVLCWPSTHTNKFKLFYILYFKDVYVVFVQCKYLNGLDNQKRLCCFSILFYTLQVVE